MRVAVYTPRPSAAAHAILVGLRAAGIKAIRSRGGSPKRPVDVVLNWGSSVYCPELKCDKWINPTNIISLVASKYRTFEKLQEAEVPCVQLTRDASVALHWLESGAAALARKDGLSQGAGIEVIDPTYFQGDEKFPDFYAKYFPKTHEFRAHVFGGKLVLLMQKKGREGADRVIRNFDNGWVYSSNISQYISGDSFRELELLAIDACAAVGADFGAVDILAKFEKPKKDSKFRKMKKAVVCEINSGPGITCEVTLSAYIEALVNYLKKIKE